MKSIEGHKNLSLHAIYSPKLIIIWLCLASTLLACASQVPLRSQIPEISSTDIDPIEINNWKWKGKFVVKNEDFSEVGSLTWLKTGHDNFVSIRGPMGVGFRKFLVRDGEIQNLSLKETQAAHKLKESLGTELPLDSIPLWLLGKGGTKLRRSKEDSHKRNTSEQSEWHITFRNWNKYKNALLPSEIIAKSKYTEVKLITLSWSPTK